MQSFSSIGKRIHARKKIGPFLTHPVLLVLKGFLKKYIFPASTCFRRIYEMPTFEFSKFLEFDFFQNLTISKFPAFSLFKQFISYNRRDRIHLPVGVEIILNFFKIFMNIGTELFTLSMEQSILLP